MPGSEGLQMWNFASRFLAAVDRFPERCALELEGKGQTYRQMAEAAFSLAATLQRSGIEGPVGLLARNSLEAYQGVLGIFLSGSTYLPLTPENPVDRNVACLRQSQCRTLLV